MNIQGNFQQERISPSDIPGCILYYKFNESGTYQSDVSGQIGSCLSGVTFTDGRFSSGLRFGSPSYFTTNHYGLASGTLTFMYWGCERDLSVENATFPGPFGIQNETSTSLIMYHNKATAGSINLNMKVYFSNGSIQDGVPGRTFITPEKWTHQVIIFDGGSMIHYKDNKLYENAVKSGVGYDSIKSPEIILLGKTQNTSNWQDITIDEFAWFNRRLNPSEISSIYDSSKQMFNLRNQENLNIKGNFEFIKNNDSGQDVYYSFNESGTSVQDQTGQVGSLYGVEFQEGYIGSCLNFQSGTLMKVTAPNNMFLTGSDSYTFSCWIRPSGWVDGVTESRIIEEQNGPVYNYPLVIRMTSGPIYRFYFARYDGSTSKTVYSPYQIIPDQWTSIITKYDHGSRYMFDYINGNLVASGLDITNFEVISGNQAATLIGNLDNRQRSYNGQLDEISLWKRAMSDEEIKGLYNQHKRKMELSTSDKINIINPWKEVTYRPNNYNPEFYFKFDEETGGVINSVVGTTSGVMIGSNVSLGEGKYISGLSTTGSSDGFRINNVNSYDCFTFSAWVKKTEEKTYTPNDYRSFLSSSNQATLIVFEDASAVSFRIPGVDTSYWGAGSAPINRWNHIVCTYDTEYRKIYINGSAVGSSASPIGGSTVNLGSMCVGRLVTAVGIRGFVGYIDELAYYSGALSYDQIKDIFNEQSQLKSINVRR